MKALVAVGSVNTGKLLNRGDISFDERECIVFGKGDKERMVYFDAKTKIHLQNYLVSRADSNVVLFVSFKTLHKRIKIGEIELRLRELGKSLNIEKYIHISLEEHWRQ